MTATTAEWVEAPRRERFAEFPIRNRVCSRVNYDALEHAEEIGRKLFPDADKIVALWTPAGEVNCAIEVWAHGHARVFGVMA